jgi:hypothetical protein
MLILRRIVLMDEENVHGNARDRRVLAGRRYRLLGGRFVNVLEAHLLHSIEVVQVAPVLLEAMCCWQGLGMVTQIVLAELASSVAKIQQELGERWCAGSQIGRAPGKLRGDHARAQRIHSGEKDVARPDVQLGMA